MFTALGRPPGALSRPCDNPGFLLGEELALGSHPLNALKSLFKVINQFLPESEQQAVGSVLTALMLGQYWGGLSSPAVAGLWGLSPCPQSCCDPDPVGALVTRPDRVLSATAAKQGEVCVIAELSHSKVVIDYFNSASTKDCYVGELNFCGFLFRSSRF